MDARQWLSAVWPSAAGAFGEGMHQVHILSSHREYEHLDPRHRNVVFHCDRLSMVFGFSLSPWIVHGQFHVVRLPDHVHNLLVHVHLLPHFVVPFSRGLHLVLQVSDWILTVDLFVTLFLHFPRLDYCGISLLIAGSIVPCLYFGFYCQSDTQVYYIAMTVVLCIGSVIVSWFDKFSESQYRPLRAGVFASFAFSSIIPAVHWYVHHEHLLLQETRLLNAIRFLMLMALLYTLGVLFYALRIPERFYPGRFDVWVCHSDSKFEQLIDFVFSTATFSSIVPHFCGCSCSCSFARIAFDGWFSIGFEQRCLCGRRIIKRPAVSIVLCSGF